jgi:hypothetical protein
MAKNLSRIKIMWEKGERKNKKREKIIYRVL